MGEHWTDRGIPLFLASYFLAHVVIRVAISSTLTLDEAEQVLLSQAFQWGYSGQPPLYAWAQHVVFGLLGTNLFGLALLKNLLLFFAYMLFWLMARRFWPGRRTLASLAVLSWLLIPQIVWEAQRDLSHSVMVLVLAVASLYWVVRVLSSPGASGSPGVGWYALYGLLMAMGFLSKYNFVAFAGALNLALLTLPKGRRVLLHPRILVSLAVSLGAFAPHLHWALEHWEVATRSMGKVEASQGNNRLLGLGTLFLAGLSFLTPLWVFCLGFSPRLFKKRSEGEGTELERLVQRYLIVLALGLVSAVLALGVGQMKERWMIPCLFLFPLFLFSRVGRLGLAPSRVRWFRRVALGAAGVTLLAAALRAVLGPTLGVTTRVNYPFDELAEVLSTEGVSGANLVTHNTWFAGNLLIRFPASHAYVPGYVLPPPVLGGEVFAVWDAVRSEGLPLEVREDLVSRFGLDPDGVEPTYVVLPYHYGAGKEARVGYVRVPS